MSSILIKDMEMPKERESFNLTIKYNGTVLDTETGMQVAEAYEVPPHGDLIERNKLREKEFIHDGDAYAVVMSRDIRNAPTIIPSEESKT